MSVVRVLHISDLHIAGNNRFYLRKWGVPSADADALSTISEMALKYSEDGLIDAILISGDVSCVGRNPDLIAAREFIVGQNVSRMDGEFLAPSRKPNLDLCGKPVIIVPGNHDRFSPTLFGPGSTLFDSVFKSFWTGGLGGTQINVLPTDADPRLAVISTDFSLANVQDASSPVYYAGQGKIYDDRLERLTHVTKNFRASHQSTAVIWMIHFAPDFEVSPVLNRHGGNWLKLINSERLTLEAQKFGVGCILCGHIHFNNIYTTNDAPQVTIRCVGASSVISGSDLSVFFHQFEIEDGNLMR